MSLDPADIEAIAVRVAELVAADDQESPGRYLDARQLARILGVERDWVYAHAAQLGAMRLGGGRGRLRFDLRHATRTLAGRPPERPASPSARRRAHRRPGVDLLPYES